MQPWMPHPFQAAAVKFMVGQGAAGLFLDPGLGKTSVTLAAFSVLKKKGLVKRMLVIAPLRPCYGVWPLEVQKWTEFSGLSLSVLHGPAKDQLIQNGDDIHVINPEGLGWLFKQQLRKNGSEPWPYDVLVIDESTRFKHTNTQRFRILKPYLKEFKRRYILTGSPAPNGLLDLFGQVYVLDGGAALGGFITHYRQTHFDPVGFGGYKWVLKPGHDKVIQEKLKPLVMRLAAEDYIDLPPLIDNLVQVTLPEGAMKQYKEMENILVTQVEGGEVVAANAAAATTKCRQIANGGIYHEGGEKWSHLHEAKVEAVQEIVEELSGKPALVAYEYRHDLERLQKAFPGAPHIGGGVSASRFAAIEVAWNRGEIPVLLAQPQSVAHGLNLQGTGAAVIWAGLTWDLEVAEQFVRRVWRQGQKESVVQHFIVAKGTVDEVIMAALKRKDKTQQSLMDALKTHLGVA
jgi:SNF2 family DNA or RNA helicase